MKGSLFLLLIIMFSVLLVHPVSASSAGTAQIVPPPSGGGGGGGVGPPTNVSTCNFTVKIVTWRPMDLRNITILIVNPLINKTVTNKTDVNGQVKNLTLTNGYYQIKATVWSVEISSEVVLPTNKTVTLAYSFVDSLRVPTILGCPLWLLTIIISAALVIARLLFGIKLPIWMWITEAAIFVGFIFGMSIWLVMTVIPDIITFIWWLNPKW